MVRVRKLLQFVREKLPHEFEDAKPIEEQLEFCYGNKVSITALERF
jgi:hypothetical protein